MITDKAPQGRKVGTRSQHTKGLVLRVVRGPHGTTKRFGEQVEILTGLTLLGPKCREIHVIKSFFDNCNRSGLFNGTILRRPKNIKKVRTYHHAAAAVLIMLNYKHVFCRWHICT